MSESVLPLSLKLLIGRLIFDGAAPEVLAKKQGVSLTDVNQAWTECRDRLSQHVAEHEQLEYHLLNDDELHARVADVIRALLDWREAALHSERLAASQRSEDIETSSKDGPDEPSVLP